MQGRPGILHHRYAAPAAIVAVSLLAQLAYCLFAPLERLVTFTLVDDAFYYLNIARHIALGHGPSFDGLHPTNGFQPLWQALLLPLGWVASREACARLACVLGALLFQATTVVLYTTAGRLFGKTTALLAAVLWAFNARLAFTYAMNGMEFALFALTVLLFFGAFMRAWDAPERTGFPAFCLLGALGGLCTLARMDGMLALALAGPALGWRLARRGWMGGAAMALAALALGFGLTALPYFIWNRASFGQWLPVSGTVKQFTTHEALAALGIAPLSAGHFVHAAKIGGYCVAKYFLRFWTGYTYYLGREAHLSQQGAGALGLVVFAGLMLGSLRFGGWRPLAAAARRMGFLLIFVGAHFAVYALLMFPFIDYGNWYFGPLYAAFCLATAIAVEPLLARAGGAVKGVLAGVMLANALTFVLLHDEPKINVMGGRDSLRFIDSRLHGEKIGSWNAGYLGFFSQGNTFVNLDGLVGDGELARHIRERRPIQEYLKAQGIVYICDYLTDPAALAEGFYGLRPGEFVILYESAYYQPPFIDSRKYYVLKLMLP